MFSDCGGVSRFEIVTWRFKGKKTFPVRSRRRTCRPTLGGEWMCTGCSLARNALCTQMKTSSLLPATETQKKKKKRRKKPIHNSFSPSLSTLDSSNTPRCRFLRGSRSFLCGSQRLETLEVQLGGAPSLKFRHCFYKREVHARQKRRIIYK